MEYVTLRLSSLNRGPIYEKDFPIEEVFGPFVRDFVSKMVHVGLLQDKQRYWAIVKPGYALPDSEESALQPDADQDTITRPRHWLSMELGETWSQDPWTCFTLELHTVAPDPKRYQRSFAVSEVSGLGSRIKNGLVQAGLIGPQEVVQMSFYARSGDAPRFGEETIHALPADLGGLEITIEDEAAPEEVFSEKSVPACGCSHEDSGSLLVFFRRSAFDRLNAYVRQHASRRQEAGGVLIGEVHRQANRGGLFVEVEGHIPARQTKADAVSLQFTHETWQALLAEKRACFGDAKQMVGWYHTHPPIPVMVGEKRVSTVGFLSTDDLAMQRKIFHRPWQVAFVMDAESDERALFCWSEGQMVQAGFHVID